MNELQIFNNAEFGQLRTLVKDNETWFVGKDVCEILKYQNGSRDINRHVDEEDRQILKSTKTVVLENGIPARGLTIINESGLYSLVLSSKLPNAKKFKRWVTSEVLPSIRKHGIYATTQTIETMLADPDNAIKVFIALKEERAKRIEQEKQIASLTAENQMQAQMISEFKPKVEYVDIILRSTDTVTTTQIAADYGLSAKKLNKILHDEKIQHKVNDQWILYKEQMNKGYTKSETIDITRSDGRVEAKMYTKWTQKGRLKIHEILTQLGFVANFDREQQALFN
ncbi:phage antirepressor [Megamonas hypermegale]|uniref:phage antirepressor n=1 Tax=Megamonas hypermegale TaxID=158847 RepID=UPI0019581775|nr:phage antirepressor KilAC domain-containing protein [Megamonas hypermegale]MBM6761974.1 phage antirepressor KilAC domain-containing protein [Megamonas hypermegale]